MKLWTWLLDLLYPRRCAFCHRLTQDNAPVCPHCLKALPYTDANAKRQFGSLAVYSPLYYEGSVRDSLLRYKFGGVRMYAEVYGEFLSKCIDENGVSCDSITWVPLSRRRLRRRGYDQARLLAEAVSAHCGVPCAALLRKTRNNPAQSRTGSAERRKENVRGVFAALPDAPIRGAHILLVDDIVTTGATLLECAEVLKKAGAAEVSALSLARRR